MQSLEPGPSQREDAAGSGSGQPNVNLEDWTVDDVQKKLEEDRRVSENIRKLLKDEKITGQRLKYITVDVLMKKGIAWGECLDLCDFLKEHGFWKSQEKKAKIFNDPIHGNISLHPTCVAVINTPQFQRLRYLKQLGLCYFVYPGAAHNRFEHCLGVSHLAGKFVRHLRENQSELGITEVDVICVEIAGLCHDLGHGPFSHLFDGKFVPEVGNALSDWKWTHEKASMDMFKYLIEDNKLMEEGGVLREFGLTERDITFIKELINPEKFEGHKFLREWNLKGREKEKAYLYEIVSNKRNGIDVDKWDYLARDCHQLGFKDNFDHDRFIKFARVIEVDGEMQICIRDKEIMNLYNMFATRYTLHKNAYQHRVNCALELMVAQALLKANDHVKIIGKNGLERNISQCIDDMVAYTALNDEILFKILYTKGEDQDLKDAQEIIRRIMKRDLYTCVVETRPVELAELERMQIKGKSQEDIKREILRSGKELKEGDFHIQVVQLDFGMKEENPVKKLKVYSKDDLNKGMDISPDKVSRILPPYICKELLLRAYSTNRSPKICELVKKTFEKWFEGKEKEASERERNGEQTEEGSRSGKRKR